MPKFDAAAKIQEVKAIVDGLVDGNPMDKENAEDYAAFFNGIKAIMVADGEKLMEEAAAMLKQM